MDLSLCVLARGRPDLLKALVDSLRGFVDIDLEVVVADNSPGAGDQIRFRELADAYTLLSDEDLGYEGFGYAKSCAVGLASAQWVAIGDLGEQWFPNPEFPMAEAIRKHGDTHPCMRVTREQEVGHGRVFDKQRMRLLGPIHEELFEKRTQTMWAAYARKLPPVAFVAHEESGVLLARKEALYDHLLDMIEESPAKRTGTNTYWLREYWPKRKAELASRGERVLTFAEWQKMEG